VLSLDDFFAVI